MRKSGRQPRRCFTPINITLHIIESRPEREKQGPYSQSRSATADANAKERQTAATLLHPNKHHSAYHRITARKRETGPIQSIEVGDGRRKCERAADSRDAASPQ